jgi:hypothetical protein
MPQICVRFRDHDYNDIEERATDQNTTKSRVVETIVSTVLADARRGEGVPDWGIVGSIVGGSRQSEQVKSMKDRVAMLEHELLDKNSQLGFLQQEYSKINSALTQRLLNEPTKKSFWDRVFRRSPRNES